MKKSAVLTIVTCSIAIVILTGVLVVGLKSDGFGIGKLLDTGSLSPEAGGEKYSYTWESEEIEGLDISWINGPIELKVGTGNEILITEVSKHVLEEKERLQISSSNGVLKIKWNSDFISFGFLQNMEKSLTITVPKETAEKLENLNCSNTSGDIKAIGFAAKNGDVSSTSGSLTVSDVKGEELSFSTVSGSMDLLNIYAEKTLDISTTSGAVKVDHFQTPETEVSSVSGKIWMSGDTNELDASSVSASIEAEFLKCPEDASMESVSGKLTMELPENDGFQAKFSSISGKFSSEFPVTGDSGKSGIAIYGSGKAELSFSTTSGKMEILKRAE